TESALSRASDSTADVRQPRAHLAPTSGHRRASNHGARSLPWTAIARRATDMVGKPFADMTPSAAPNGAFCVRVSASAYLLANVAGAGEWCSWLLVMRGRRRAAARW